jgi:hypothetical protein
MFLTNMGERPARIGFDVVAGGTHYYLTRLKLQPRETRAIDLRKLRDEQKPDFRKNRIPINATDGSVLWSRLDNVPIMGRLVVLQRHKGIASNYDCETCPCADSFTGWLDVIPNTYTMTVGETEGYNAIAQYRKCNGTFVYYDRTQGSGWMTSNSSIAKLNGISGGQMIVQGMSGGTAYIRATHTGPNWIWCPPKCQVGNPPANTGTDEGQCKVKPSITGISPTQDPRGDTYTVTITGKGFTANPSADASVNAGSGIIATIDPTSTDTSIKSYFLIQASAPGGNHNVTVTTSAGASNSVSFYVQIPTTVEIAYSSQPNEAPCTLGGGGTGCGTFRTVNWRVLDQHAPAQPITAVMSVYDTIAFGSPNDFNANSSNVQTTCSPFNSGPCGVYTDSNGVTPGDVNGVCSSLCYSGGACIAPNLSTVLIQTWHVNSTGVAPNQLTIKCDRVLINGQ